MRNTHPRVLLQSPAIRADADDWAVCIPLAEYGQSAVLRLAQAWISVSFGHATSSTGSDFVTD
jgi:hypothetical protein